MYLVKPKLRRRDWAQRDQRCGHGHEGCLKPHREEGYDTQMPRAGLNPRQCPGVQAEDTKERHELLAKRRVGRCYFQKSRRKVMKSGLPSFIVGLNFSLSWLLMGRCQGPCQQDFNNEMLKSMEIEGRFSSVQSLSRVRLFVTP